MRIVVFGATGTVGRHVVEQALQQGHAVTAFSRDRARVAGPAGRVHVAEGALTDATALDRVVAGQDAVVVVLGGGRRGDVRAPGTAAVIAAMRRTGVRRLIVQSTLGAGDSRGNLNLLWRHVMFGMLLRAAYADHERQEQLVRGSDLDWTIVRPAAFTDGPRTGGYRHGFGPRERSRLRISRADVADFVLAQLTDDRYLRAAPALSY